MNGFMDYNVNDAVAARRAAVAPAPRPAGGQMSMPQGARTNDYYTSGNEGMDRARRSAFADAAARIRAARSAASWGVGADPAAAGYASLNADFNGQSDAANAVNRGVYSYLDRQEQWAHEIAMLERQERMQREMQRMAARNALLSGFGQLGGAALGSWMAPGGWWGEAAPVAR